MRKALMIATAAVALMSAPAFAAEPYYEYNPAAPIDVTTGAVTGTVAGVDAVIQPCRGLQAVFGMNRAECAARQQIALAPQTTHRRTVHR